MSILGLFDYPKEIKQLQKQLPKTEQEAFLHKYKKLSSQNKTSFKQALRDADLASANKILGENLNQFHVTLMKQATKNDHKGLAQGKGGQSVAAVTGAAVTGAAIVAQTSKMPGTPAMVPAEAARRYDSTPTTFANQTKLLRIDSSGVFAVPDELSANNIKSVLVNGKPIADNKYAITENGNVDVFEANKDSVVSIILK